MNTVTHAMTVNGRIHGELKDPFNPPEAQIRKSLALLDGSRRFSLILWAIPRGISFSKVDLGSEPKEYIQAAGSCERMTVEVRRIEAGKPRQYVIGRSTPSGGGQHQPEVIKWDGGIETVVSPSEVFTAEQAADLFVSYYATGWIPESYALRLLHVRAADHPGDTS